MEKRNQPRQLDELMDRNITAEYRELIVGLGYARDTDEDRSKQSIYGRNELDAPENSDRRFRYAAVLKRDKLGRRERIIDAEHKLPKTTGVVFHPAIKVAASLVILRMAIYRVARKPKDRLVIDGWEKRGEYGD